MGTTNPKHDPSTGTKTLRVSKWEDLELRDWGSGSKYPIHPKA